MRPLYYGAMHRPLFALVLTLVLTACGACSPSAQQVTHTVVVETADCSAHLVQVITCYQVRDAGCVLAAVAQLVSCFVAHPKVSPIPTAPIPTDAPPAAGTLVPPVATGTYTSPGSHAPGLVYVGLVNRWTGDPPYLPSPGHVRAVACTPELAPLGQPLLL